MDVRIQQAVSEARPTKARDAPLEMGKQDPAVAVIAHQSFACISLGDDMVDGAWSLFSRPTRHLRRIAREEGIREWPIGALPVGTRPEWTWPGSDPGSDP